MNDLDNNAPKLAVQLTLVCEYPRFRNHVARTTITFNVARTTVQSHLMSLVLRSHLMSLVLQSHLLSLVLWLHFMLLVLQSHLMSLALRSQISNLISKVAINFNGKLESNNDSVTTDLFIYNNSSLQTVT